MFDGISIWQLLIVLAIVIVIFGTKRLSSLGGDVGNAIKSFKKAMHDDGEPTAPAATPADAEFTATDRDGEAKPHAKS